jgi:hypothetical protein
MAILAMPEHGQDARGTKSSHASHECFGRKTRINIIATQRHPSANRYAQRRGYKLTDFPDSLRFDIPPISR